MSEDSGKRENSGKLVWRPPPILEASICPRCQGLVKWEKGREGKEREGKGRKENICHTLISQAMDFFPKLLSPGTLWYGLWKIVTRSAPCGTCVNIETFDILESSKNLLHTIPNAEMFKIVKVFSWDLYINLQINTAFFVPP